MGRSFTAFGNTSSLRKPLVAVFLLAVCALVFGSAPFSLQVVNSQVKMKDGHRRARSLSFDERVAYQRAVEEVYWRRTIWPRENAGPKPALAQVAPLEATRAEVEDYLRQSDALARLWKSPVTPAQLQSEVARMARETKQPEVLRELWGALDNDPFIIAEVLARPVLVERLSRNFFSSDERVHGALRAKVEGLLREHRTLEALRRAGAKFSQVEAVKVARRSRVTDVSAAAATARAKDAAVELTADEWEAGTARLRESLGAASCETCGGETAASPGDGLGRLQEDENSFYVTSVLADTDKRLQVARVEWAKTSFDSWWAGERLRYDAVAASTEAFDYQPEEINQSAADDTWTPTKALPEATGTAVWTGTEMIIWGGGKQNSGARYNPATDTWTPTSATDVPSHRSGHTAVWTGTEMIVWGGCERHFHFCGTNDGGRYNPRTDTWAGMSITNAPPPRSRHVAVWTGSKMIVWAGVRHEYRNQPHPISSGGVYDPASDSWTTMNETNSPGDGGSGFTVVWTGAEMIAWGGNLSVGGRYNPDTDTWTPTSPVNAPSPRTDHTAVWTGTEMIVWGGTSGAGSLNTGGRYRPSSDTWTPTSTAGAPEARYMHTAVWTGTEMIVWGGSNPLPTNTGGRYNPASDSWTQTNTANAPPPKSGHVAVWTGELMIVWSVADNKTGGRYNPANDSWTPTDNNDSPPPTLFGVWTGAEMIIWYPTGYCPAGGCPTLSKRYDPATYTWRPMSNVGAPNPPPSDRPIAAVWTGTEMIVWGVNIWSSGPGEGGRYNPQTDSWRPVTTNGAPVGRSFFTGVWTGSEMIVWGGQGNDGTTQNTGGRYDPSTDTWRPTSTAGAPAARYIHSAVWTDTEMIVWGGVSDTGGHENTGGRYNPVNDAWTPTSTTGAPEARRYHTAVWTGAEMIVWGGRIGDYNDSAGLFNTGGRYRPSSDTWTPTSTAGAPSPRFKHTAVWTGELMIVWGGIALNDLGYALSTNTGGRYQPRADAWTPTSTLRAPGRRHDHIAFWTASGMLVWGGYAEDGSASHGGLYVAPGSADGDTPPSSARITGRVVNAQGSGVSNIRVRLDASQGTTPQFADTNPDGSYQFGNLPNGGNYTVTPESTGYTFAPPTRTFTNLSAEQAADFNATPNTAPTPPPLVNVALAANGGVASASSTTPLSDGIGSYPASAVNNGDRRGLNWGAGGGWRDATADAYPDWVEVKFDGPKAISELNLFTIQDDPDHPAEPTEAQTFSLYGITSFDLLYWDGTNWQAIPGGTVVANNRVWRKFSFAELITDRVRVVIKGALYGRSRIIELEAFGTAVAAPPPPPSRVNVALAANGARATASSSYSSGFSPDGVINGDRRGLSWEAGGGWADATPNSFPDWLEVRFDGSKSIDEVDLFTLQDDYADPAEPTEGMLAGSLGLLDFEVQYWDGGTWRTVEGGSVRANDRVWRRFTFAAITTDRIRVYITNSRPSFSRIVELEAYEASVPAPPPPPAKPNVALAANGARATASSSYSSGFSPDGAINGDRRGLSWEAGGGWADATPDAYADWLQVEFDGAKAITEIDVFTLQDNYWNPGEPTEGMLAANLGLLDFEVQYWDGGAWRTVPGGGVTANDRVWRKFTFPEVTTTRIRVYVTRSRPSYSRIVELEAY